MEKEESLWMSVCAYTLAHLLVSLDSVPLMTGTLQDSILIQRCPVNVSLQLLL
jgi:hypothetical protein